MEIDWKEIFPEVKERTAAEIVREAEREIRRRQERKDFLLQEQKERFGAELTHREKLVESLKRVEAELEAEIQSLRDPHEGLIAQEIEFESSLTKLENEIQTKTRQLTVYGILVQLTHFNKERTFVKCYNACNNFEVHFKKGELIKASRFLVLLRESLNTLQSESNYISGKDLPKIKIIDIFHEKFANSKKLIEKKLEAIFEESIQFSQNTMRIASRMKQASGYEATLIEVLVCLTGLSLIQDALIHFGDKFLSFLEMNIGTKDGKVDFMLDVKATNGSDHTTQIEISRRALTDAEASALAFPSQKLLGSSVRSIGLVMEHLKSKTENSKINFMDQLRNAILEKFLLSIKERILLPLLPQESAKIPEFMNYYKALAAKLDQALTMNGFFKQGETPFSAMVADIKDKYVERLSQCVLDEARSLLFASNTELVSIQGHDNSSNFGQKDALHFQNLGFSEESFFKFPTCKVSQRIIHFIEFLKKPLKEINKDTLSSENCIRLYKTSRNLLELFMASYEVGHRDISANLPSARALYYNDCMYLSRRLLTLITEFKSRFPQSLDTAATFLDFVEPLIERADASWNSHLESQISILEESFEVMGGLGDTDKGKRFTQVEQALKQLLHKLTKTSAAWKEVLPEFVYIRSISKLIEFVISTLCSEMLKLSDIGATECDSLPELLKLMYKAESFVQIPSHSVLHFLDYYCFCCILTPFSPMFPIAQCVPSWTRYRTIVSLLTTSLVDIGPLFKTGKLNSLSKDEIAFMVKALFADSERRRALLATIQ